jgi:V/A-type H+/Na+-transporting ATPase subunit K
MDGFMLAMGWAGVYAPTALGAMGSIVGCTRAGQAACGAMLDIESGYGRYVGVSALPSSQTIYGIVVMFALRPADGAVVIESAPGLFAIGVLAGLALMMSAMYQGSCCASAINASKSKPEIFGLAIAPAAIVEGFSVFAFIFAMILGADIPGAAPVDPGPP